MAFFSDPSLSLLGIVHGFHLAIISSQQHVLILSSQSSALKPQHSTQHLLHVIRHFYGRLPSGLTRHLLRQPIQKRYLIGGPRVHEVKIGVPELHPSDGGAVEHVLLHVHRHRHDAVAEFREQCAKPEEVGLAAGGPLWADHEVALLENGGDAGSVGGAVAGEGDGGDGGEEAREAADAVGDAGDLAAEGDGDDDGVQGGAVVADVEVAGGTWGGGRRRVASDNKVDAQHRVGVADDALWEGEVEVDSEDRECKPKWKPEVDDEGREWRGGLDEPTIVEYYWGFQAVGWHRRS